MNQLERRALAFEVRKTSDDGSEFDGYASCFYNMDSYYSMFASGCWSEDLGRFLSAGVVLWQHNSETPIGSPTAASEDPRGLFVGAKISDTAAGKDAKILLKDGVVKSLSVGFVAKGQEWLDTAEEVAQAWAAAGYTPSPDDIAASQYGCRMITKAKLYEFSPVSFPANAMCDITDVRQDAAEPRDGIRFEDQLIRALDAVRELGERARSIHDRRHSEGRSLSEVRLGQIRAIRMSLDELLATANEPAQTETPAETDEARARRFRLLALRADELRLTA